MRKEFLSYELSLKLKAIGFDEPCLGLYYDDGKANEFANVSKKGRMTFLRNSDEPWRVTRVLYQQAFRWFRENHNLYYIIDKQGYWFYEIIIDEGFGDLTKDVIVFYDYKSYEEAELACLEKLIEIVESKIKNNESDITKN